MRLSILAVIALTVLAACDGTYGSGASSSTGGGSSYRSSSDY
ncbi:MAG: hypothetical protein AAGA87_13290 [Pseudomonadota bacterium]